MNIDAVESALVAIDRTNIESVDDLLSYSVPNTITHEKQYLVPEIEELTNDPAAVNILCAKLILKKLDKLAG